MALTVYDDVILPTIILAAGVTGKSIRKNERVQNQGGFDQINVIWQRTVRQFQIGTVPMTQVAWEAIEGLYEVTDAGAFGFLMEDPKDYNVPSTQGFMQPLMQGVPAGTSGFGYGVPTMQLVKRYTSSGSTRTRDRNITRPRTNTVVLYRAASPVTIGAAPGNATVNVDTGIVTFVADTSEAMTSITVGASTVLNFASGAGMVAAMNVGDRVYLNGVTGTAAATLNTLSHAITAKGASSLTISTTTTGLTASSGTAYKYPQATDTLTWQGLFYVPVHFVNDEIDWQLVVSGPQGSRFLSGPQVILEEVRE